MTANTKALLGTKQIKSQEAINAKKERAANIAKSLMEKLQCQSQKH